MVNSRSINDLSLTFINNNIAFIEDFLFQTKKIWIRCVKLVFLRFVTEAFLLFLAPAWGPYPAGPIF